jgi:hypothetical protein
VQRLRAVSSVSLSVLRRHFALLHPRRQRSRGGRHACSMHARACGVFCARASCGALLRAGVWIASRALLPAPAPVLPRAVQRRRVRIWRVGRGRGEPGAVQVPVRERGRLGGAPGSVQPVPAESGGGADAVPAGVAVARVRPRATQRIGRRRRAADVYARAVYRATRLAVLGGPFSSQPSMGLKGHFIYLVYIM